jgi:phosphopantothenoylcysteine synthetase/decarboxylase
VSALEVDHALSSTRASAAKQATKKLVGTPVTLESFAAWRAKFEAEMLAHNTDPTLGISLDPTVKKDAARLSGREQFLLASAGSLKLDLGAADAADEDGDDDDDDDDDDEDDDDEDDDGAADDDRVVMSAVIDSSVFAAESTAELDNLEFSDEE